MLLMWNLSHKTFYNVWHIHFQVEVEKATKYVDIMRAESAARFDGNASVWQRHFPDPKPTLDLLLGPSIDVYQSVVRHDEQCQNKWKSGLSNLLAGVSVCLPLLIAFQIICSVTWILSSRSTGVFSKGLQITSSAAEFQEIKASKLGCCWCYPFTATSCKMRCLIVTISSGVKYFVLLKSCHILNPSYMKLLLVCEALVDGIHQIFIAD